ncbi:MAG: hypothetical protein JWP47_3033 [Polaromonas sp.]|nr:hypothetical protein [Polaromonas sp.]
MNADYYITGYVYFIQAGADRAVKVGRTVELEKRFFALQTSNRRKLRLIGATELRKSGCFGELNRVKYGHITRQKDVEIHQRFAQDRIHGDWFKLTTGLAAFISGVSNIDAVA